MCQDSFSNMYLAECLQKNWLRTRNKKQRNKKIQTSDFSYLDLCFCAQNRTRTCTSLLILVPETSASTNSAIRANLYCKITEHPASFQNYRISFASCEVSRTEYRFEILIVVSLYASNVEGISMIFIMSIRTPVRQSLEYNLGSPNS